MGLQIDESDLGWIREQLSAAGMTRFRLSNELCKRKGWYDAKGRPRGMSARVFLNRLHKNSTITLPPPRQTFFTSSAKDSAKRRGDSSEPKKLKALSEEIISWSKEQVRIELISSKVLRKRWGELLEDYHPLGAGPLCGAQLRYLVYLNGAAVGGLSFSAPAHALMPRDHWIGWSVAARKDNLQLVVCNSRFLLTIKAPNLASYVLSSITKRLSDDWFGKYGIRPQLVETFVDKSRYLGVCYKAANWRYIGETTGRGRNDTDRTANIEKKDIFVLPLEDGWRKKLCREPIRKLDEDQSWAKTEFGSTDLGDKRVNARLVELADDFFKKPLASIPQACGTINKTKGAYRLLSHENATMDNLLANHYESTLSRCAKEKRVFAIQDTTSLNYSTRLATQDLGPIGSYGAQATLGLLVHSTFMLSETDVPLGLMDVKCWSRSQDEKDYGKANERYDLPIEDKESNKWLEGFNAVAESAYRASDTEFVVMGDRESDIFELFNLNREKALSNLHLLVRATHQRKIRLASGENSYLWDYVESLASAGELNVSIPRRGKLAARDARVELRFAEVDVVSPDKPFTKHLKAVKLFAIAAKEIVAETDKDKNPEPLKWLLLTTKPVATFQEAVEKVSWYTKRWHIEVFHRTLKSGCRIEDRQLGSAHSLQAALSIDLVVAWRIFHLAKLGREVPDSPCTVFFEDYEWKALICFVNQTPIPPSEPPSLKDALIMVAKLGGFLGRKGDGMPGTETLWRGIERLSDIAAACAIFLDNKYRQADLNPQ